MVAKIDTGSTHTFIKLESLRNKLHLFNINKNVNGYFNCLSKDNKISRIGLTDPLTIKYTNGISFKHQFEVMDFNDSFDFDILLGTDIMSKMGIALTGVAYNLEDDSADPSDKDSIFSNANIVTTDTPEPDNSPAGSQKEAAQFMASIQDNTDNNQKIPVESYCPIPESIVKLPTPEGATAYRRQYSIPHTLRPVLDEQIKEWLKTKTIEKCGVNTSFNSPLLLVPKKNKQGEIVSHRACLDVRLLNKILPPTYNFEVPLVRNIFENLRGKKVFSTLDLSNAYHRFKIHPPDSHKLTFSHNGQQYCFIKGCFGLKSLTSQFCKVMAILFEGMDCVQSFVDDCIVASETPEQHAKDVAMVIVRLTNAKLILNPKKCVWFQQSVRMLGFVVNADGIMVDKAKLTNVESWPVPKTAKHIQQFMGLINYFREFVPMISTVAEPLTRLSHAKNVEELWSDEQDKSFNALKEILHSSMLLHYPDFTKEFFVASDASQYGISAVLFQRDDKGRDKYISFVSNALSPSQRRWSATRRELYGVLMAFRRFHQYIWGRRFTLHTDHKALTYMHTQRDCNHMMLNWFEEILTYDFDAVHIPGILLKLPDLLSRLYSPLEHFQSDHKLVEGSTGSKKQKDQVAKIKRVAVRRKKYSRDKNLHVLTTKLVEQTKDALDYFTPPETEREKLLRESTLR